MRAIVTGASHGGMGEAIAMKLAMDARGRGEKARIVVTATGTKPGFKAVEEAIRAAGADVLALTGDMTDMIVPARIATQAIEFCGGLDAVASNAGFALQAQLNELQVDEWDKLYAIHVRSHWLLAKACYPALKESHGAFVATGSMTATTPHAGNGGYASAKAALVRLCETLAIEWGHDGIRVNVVSPGSIRTPLNTHYKDPRIVAARQAMIPLGRLGEPSDIANAICFLLGPEAAYITGENLIVDGGLIKSNLDRIRAGRDVLT